MKSKREKLCMYNRVRRQENFFLEMAEKIYCSLNRQGAALYKFAALVVAILLFVAVIIWNKSDSISVSAHSDRELYYCSVQVQEGDTLWSIAEEHMTEDWRSTREYVKAIKKLNQKESDYIYAGMYLSIPYYR